MDETLRVRHHAQDAAGRVAQGGDVVGRSVGIDGIVAEYAGLVYIAEGDLAVGLHGVENVVVGEAHFALAVRDGQVNLLVGCNKDAFVGIGL